ncbi:hypothetical protein QBC47DRAFT_12066 [Echria macrotheca]|uniref:Uncharacterized protein n=1 Tax=Echria macrotheca TaxID=438768 RepID=A0AAJ0BPC0_9PEZI|nr:hypothetical protein QBC47DRAFT_12066 [Echria macrotheca]
MLVLVSQHSLPTLCISLLMKATLIFKRLNIMKQKKRGRCLPWIDRQTLQSPVSVICSKKTMNKYRPFCPPFPSSFSASSSVSVSTGRGEMGKRLDIHSRQNLFGPVSTSALFPARSTSNGQILQPTVDTMSTPSWTPLLGACSLQEASPHLARKRGSCNVTLRERGIRTHVYPPNGKEGTKKEEGCLSGDRHHRFLARS